MDRNQLGDSNQNKDDNSGKCPSSAVKRKRGPTYLSKQSSSNERLPLQFNMQGVPMGEYAARFKTSLGLAARSRVPIIYSDWKKDVPKDKKELVWTDITARFDIPEDKMHKDYVLRLAGVSWRNFKTTLTREFVRGDKCGGDAPTVYNFIKPEHWRQFVASRNEQKFIQQGSINAKRAKMNKYHHTMSRGGCVLAEELLRKETQESNQGTGLEDGEVRPVQETPIERHEVWIRARKTKKGGYLNQTAEDVVQKIADTKELASAGIFVPQGRNDILTQAIGTPEYPGRTRGVGMTVGWKRVFESASKCLKVPQSAPSTQMTPSHPVIAQECYSSAADDIFVGIPETTSVENSSCNLNELVERTIRENSLCNMDETVEHRQMEDAAACPLGQGQGTVEEEDPFQIFCKKLEEQGEKVFAAVKGFNNLHEEGRLLYPQRAEILAIQNKVGIALGGLLIKHTAEACQVEIQGENLSSGGDMGHSLDSVVDVNVSASHVEDVDYRIIRSPGKSPARKLLILDLNGLIAHIIHDPVHYPYNTEPDIKFPTKAVFKRPFYLSFLQFCFDHFDVAIWSSRMKKNMDDVLNYLIGEMKDKLVFYWDQSHCTKTDFKTLENSRKQLFLKELRSIWDNPDQVHLGKYNESNTLLVDDSPYKALLNPAGTAIFPFPFQYKDVNNDCSLGPKGDLRTYLERLITTDNIPEYVRSNPFGQEPIANNHPYWDFYDMVIKSVLKKRKKEAVEAEEATRWKRWKR